MNNDELIWAVQVVTERGSGTGVMFFPSNADSFYIITAKHVLIKPGNGNALDSEISVRDIKHPSIPIHSIALNGEEVIMYSDGDEDIAIIVIKKDLLNIKDVAAFDNPPSLTNNFGLDDCLIAGYPKFAENGEIRKITCYFEAFRNSQDHLFVVQSKISLSTLYTDPAENTKGLSGSGTYLKYGNEKFFIGIITDFVDIDSFYGTGVKAINELLGANDFPQIPTNEIVIDKEERQLVEAIRHNNKFVRAKVKDKIGDLHVPRFFAEEVMKDFDLNTVLVIYGKAGVGKSAFANELVDKYSDKNEVLMFTGEQFCTDTLDLVLQRLHAGSLTSFEMALSIQTFEQDKIIWIESAEKLIETEMMGAFVELLDVVKVKKGLKIVVTIRGYMLHLFKLKLAFNLPKSVAYCEVPVFTDGELQQVSAAYQGLDLLLEKNAINNLLHIPFYLKYAVNLLHILNCELSMSERQFREIIWRENIIKGNRERGQAFEQLSVKRAKEMSLFTRVSADASLIKSLFEDDLILIEEDELKERYCPSHDVLEDWALIRYVIRVRRDYPTTKAFFHALGNELPIRRAFRLWLGEALQTIDGELSQFINESLAQPSLESYWKDEIYVSIMRSDYAEEYFLLNESLLLHNDCALAYKLIQLLRTACKEDAKDATEEKNTVMLGSGWASTAKFLYKNKEKFSKNPFAVYLFLLEWKAKSSIEDLGEEEGRAVALHIFYIKNVIEGAIKGLSTKRGLSDVFDEGLKLIFQLTRFARQEVNAFILGCERNADRSVAQPNYDLIEFSEKVVLMALDGLVDNEICRFLPGLIIGIFERRIFGIKERSDEHADYFGNRPDTEIEFEFGLKYDYGYKCFPPSSFQTPFYWLLKYHPGRSLRIVIKLLDYCTGEYAGSNYSKQDEIEDIDLTLNDGTHVNQSGSYTIWQMYRGTGAPTPAILQSVLMALEKWMLELAESKNEAVQKGLRKIFEFILRNSKSIATTSVLASVALSQPDVLGDLVLPLLRSTHILLWETHRYMADLTFTGIGYIGKKSSHDTESERSNSLKHRKYHNGLARLIIHFQQQGGKLRDMVWDVLDVHFASLNDNDSAYWHKYLADVDIRKWQIEIDNNDPTIGYLTPNYTGKAKELVNEGKGNITKSNDEAVYMDWIRKKYEANESPEEGMQAFKKIISYYKEGKFEEKLFALPATLAVIGLRDYRTNLSGEEKDWCVDAIREIIRQLIEERFLADYHSRLPAYHLMDLDPCLSFFPQLMFSVAHSDDELASLKVLYYELLLAPLHTHEYNKLLPSARVDLWELNDEYAYSCFELLIRFGNLYQKKNGWREHYGWNTKQRRADTSSFIENIGKNIADDELVVELSRKTSNFYSKALLIAPANIDREVYRQFAFFLLEAYMGVLENEDNRHGNWEFHEDIGVIEEVTAEVMLSQSPSFGNSIVDFLYDKFNSSERTFFRTSKKEEFITKIISNIIRTVDRNHKLSASFWLIWDYIHGKNAAASKVSFANELVLNIEWKEQAVDWMPLEGRGTQFSKLLLYYGPTDLSAVINVLSTIGDNQLMPQGISLVAGIYKGIGVGQSKLLGNATVRFIQRAFYRHGKQIKSNRALLDDFLFLLDKLTDMGLSEAYMIREDLITYRIAN